VTEGISKEMIDHILQNIQDDNLTDWEKDFVKSVSGYWKRHQHLSTKQMKRLGEVWESSRNPRPKEAGQ
jgi:hypothetical protein